MKITKYQITIIIFTALAGACSKNYTGPVSTGVTSLNIVNAITGSSPIIANINGQLPYYVGQITIGPGAYQPYKFAGGSTSISFVQSSDTATTFLTTKSIPLDNYMVHSLFLSGSTSSLDTLLITDNLIDYSGKPSAPDSSTGIRFVNLSTGSNPISINQQGLVNGSEVSSLPYQAITGFTKYSATSNVSSYIFEFRDQSSGNLLATYELDGVNNGSNGNTSINSVRFKNLTIIFQGLPGSQSTFLMSDF